MGIFLGNGLDGPKALRSQTMIVRQFDMGLQPALGLAIRATYVNVHAGLFA